MTEDLKALAEDLLELKQTMKYTNYTIDNKFGFIMIGLQVYFWLEPIKEGSNLHIPMVEINGEKFKLTDYIRRNEE